MPIAWLKDTTDTLKKQGRFYGIRQNLQFTFSYIWDTLVLQNNIENELTIRICILNIIILFDALHKLQKQKVMVMFSSVFSTKKARMAIKLLGAFSIVVVMGMLTPNIQIEKS